MLHPVSNVQSAFRCCGSTGASQTGQTANTMQRSYRVSSHACCTSRAGLPSPSHSFSGWRPASVYVSVNQVSGAHSQGHRRNDTHISSAFSSMLDQQINSASVTYLTQAAIVLCSSFIAPGWKAVGRYLSGAVFWPYLSFILRAKGQLNLSDCTFAGILVYGIKALVTTVMVALLCRLQGTSLPQLMRLDFSNPGQVLGRAGLTAAAALAADALLWACMSQEVKDNPVYAYTHFGDARAITMDSALALILAPVFEELLFRGFVLQTMVNFAPHLVPVHVFTTSLQFTTAHHANALSMLTIVISGLCLGTSYLQSGMNLLVPIIAHSLINLGVMVYMAMQP